jgi:hypothetical protein
MIADMIVVLDEGADLPLEIASQVVVVEQDAVLQGPMPAQFPIPPQAIVPPKHADPNVSQKQLNTGVSSAISDL